MWPGQPPLLVPLSGPQRGQKGGAGGWRPPLREGAEAAALRPQLRELEERAAGLGQPQVLRPPLQGRGL